MSKRIVRRWNRKVFVVRAASVVAATLSASCAPARPAAAPSFDASAQLHAAEALLTIGCFDCLTEALAGFEGVAQQPRADVAATESASRGVIRAALLLELRSRELGLERSTPADYLTRVDGILAARPDLQHLFQDAVEIVRAHPPASERFAAPPNAGERERRRAADEALRARGDSLRASADRDVLDAYTWIAFTCRAGTSNTLAWARAERAEQALLEPLVRLRRTPIVRYRAATCVESSSRALEQLLVEEPRFAEVAYWLGRAAMGALDLELAERFLQQAYAWRRDWPAVTSDLGAVYTAFEEFERALDYYGQTVAMTPAHGEARIGRVRALSYLHRHPEAFAAIDDLLESPARAFPGEAYYWRAWNRFRLGELDAAWSAVEEATALWVNSEVAKLAGFISYRRGDLETARTRFQESKRLNPSDCEVLYNVGSILAEQTAWQTSATELRETISCLEAARVLATRDIDSIRAMDMAADRKARQVARREEQIAAAGRMLAAAWFNSAVAHFNLRQAEEARAFAERVIDDERFGERAREIVQRLSAAP